MSQKKSNNRLEIEVPLKVAKMLESNQSLCPDEIDEDDKDIDSLRNSGVLLEKLLDFVMTTRRNL